MSRSIKKGPFVEPKLLKTIEAMNLLGAKGKNLILVDHNESIQAAEGAESANILEIIDHHRLGTINTIAPVYFRNQPLGCTSTIIYQIFREKNIEIPWADGGMSSLCVLARRPSRRIRRR